MRYETGLQYNKIQNHNQAKTELLTELSDVAPDIKLSTPIELAFDLFLLILKHAE